MASRIALHADLQDNETKHLLPWWINYTYEDVNVKLPAKIAKLAVEHGATNFIHVSALAADPYSISTWARTKAMGEEAVRAEAPGATIVRPADVFGPEDRFLNLFAQMYNLFPRPILVDGGNARVQPLYVNDLAQAIYKIALSEDPEVMLGQVRAASGGTMHGRAASSWMHAPLSPHAHVLVRSLPTLFAHICRRMTSLAPRNTLTGKWSNSCLNKLGPVSAAFRLWTVMTLRLFSSHSLATIS